MVAEEAGALSVAFFAFCGDWSCATVGAAVMEAALMAANAAIIMWRFILDAPVRGPLSPAPHATPHPFSVASYMIFQMRTGCVEIMAASAAYGDLISIGKFGRRADPARAACDHGALRAQQARLVVGRLAGPDMRPARTMGGIPAQPKPPGRRLATRRITPPIVVAEELTNVAARGRGITRGLQGQKARKTARGTVRKDRWPNR